MKWSNVKLIFLREIRDQLRDRRTMFMIVVLPVILYPILGLGMAQLTLRFSEIRRTVGIVGAQWLPESPPLLDENKDHFHPDLFTKPSAGRNVAVVLLEKANPEDLLTRAVNAIIVVPEGAARKLAAGEEVRFRVIHNGVDDASLVARGAAIDILSEWEEKIVARRVEALGRSADFVHPIRLDTEQADISTAVQRSGAVWGKVFPFVLVMMALTGAFYPAADLCAGEKERGTMETLLITPASRAEIVLGKFLTVFTFSVATTICNLTSMALTVSQFSGLAERTGAAIAFSPPSVVSVVMMIVLMLPLAGFFSAMCMALAIFARSSKEAQYYLMPILLVVMPLVVLTLAPGVELNPFYSLVPVTNVALLARAFALNQFDKSLVYLIPVMAPTILYAYLALRYAVEQFKREDVLFREAEPFNLALWIRQLMREKESTPSGAEAWFCFILMLALMGYSQGRLSPTLRSQAIIQLALIGFPPLLLAVMLTTSVKRTLAFRIPAFWPALVGLCLVPTLHPIVITWGETLKDLIPSSKAEEVNEVFKQFFSGVTLGQKLLVIAIIPAICEELAFRGFILSGLLRSHPPGRAIAISAILFGVFHMVPEQMVTASILGVVLGLIATRSGSIFPGMIFHALHNGLVIMRGEWSRGEEGASTSYSPLWVVAAALASALLAGYLATMPSRLPERRLLPR